ncbi:HAAS domain-containing protein [Oceanobacillus damuensis]|uniref:HAAS domain-containing protein n=1 Tax=Oceanobacillus damuensis TaxID=937928 RepID=UPI000836029A|nr:hypothetical protein [Oceanobacillus damuensis]
MVKEEVELSEESKKFLEDLRVYLFSSGKSESEIKELAEELEDHFVEAEKNGKSIEHIIGHSPKDYMDQLAAEMSVDYKTWSKYIPLIIIGAFSFVIISDLFEGTLSYSLLEIFGFIGITLFFLAGTSFIFRYVSGNNLNRKQEFAILFILGILPTALFVCLILLNSKIDTPIVHFGMADTIIIAIVTFIFLTAFSIWTRSWVLIVFIALLNLPDFLLGLTSMSESLRLTASTLTTFAGLAIYLLLVSRMAKR